MIIKTNVRSLVEFLYRSGDIDRTRGGGSEAAMAQGSRIHRKLQSMEGASYSSEVPLAYIDRGGSYDILIEGRADGIIDLRSVSKEPEGLAPAFTIDEIKGTYRDVKRIEEPVMVHLAQALCYAYMYMSETGSGEEDRIDIRLTYCNMDTEDITRIIKSYSAKELMSWFEETIRQYREWTDIEYEGRIRMEKSGADVPFPFEYRNGQRKLINQVYTTLGQEKKLFLQAPTGTGKTLSVLYPAIKAMAFEKAKRIFYLTARTTGRTVCREALSLLMEKGLWLRFTELNARERICFMDHADCDPSSCEYAKGHFDRVNKVLYDLISRESRCDTDTIRDYAKKGMVCPFELSLDASIFSHCIIGDYNYAFDPEACLQRFFGEGTSNDNIFLIDEAHNLLERARDMYSADLSEASVSALRKVFLKREKRISAGTGRVKKQLKALVGDESYNIVKVPDSLISELELIYDRLGSFFEKTSREKRMGSPAPGGGISPEEMDTALEFYFNLNHFISMYEEMEDDYATYTHRDENGRGILVLYCTDPSKKLEKRMKKAASSVLFSATFLPIQYYKGLLGGKGEDYEVYATSSFDPGRQKIILAKDVTSLYNARGRDMYLKMAGYIHLMAAGKRGHYMAFFPSYKLMKDVYDLYMESFHDGDIRCIIQEPGMGEAQREEFISAFRDEEPDKGLIGFCILGGIFSEGIDLKKDALIGIIIAGTGTPMVCTQRELLKSHFDQDGKNGFDYSYRYPGMNKVLQAAGRLIRTAEDKGVVVLMDRRFTESSYRRLFPREWVNPVVTDLDNVTKEIRQFWEKYNDI